MKKKKYMTWREKLNICISERKGGRKQKKTEKRNSHLQEPSEGFF